MKTFPLHQDNKSLVITNEANLLKQKEEILKRLKKGEHIYVFYDTETTGTDPYPKKSADGSFVPRDRIIEIGMLFYGINEKGKLDQIMVDGEPVKFQEYINPAREDAGELKKFNSKIPVNDSHGIIAKYKQQDKPFELFLSIYLKTLKLNNKAYHDEVVKDLDSTRALLVHGTDLDFLNGNGTLGGMSLPKPAPTFTEIRPFMDEILCVNELPDPEVTGKIVALGHNSLLFDNVFLSMEMERDDFVFHPMVETPRSFDSMVSDVKDTMVMMKELWNRDELKDINSDNSFQVQTAFGDMMKPGFSMSYLAHVLNVKETGRENFHGALLDSEILASCFVGLLEHPKYKSAPNPLPIPAPVHDFLSNKVNETYVLPEMNAVQSVQSGNNKVLHMVQTDASLQEGTGTIGEYVDQAKKLGIQELAMIDVGTMMGFVPFYEACTKNDIKPIIGATFKFESFADVPFYIGENKKNGAYECFNTTTKDILKTINIDIEDLEQFLLENNSTKLPVIDEYFEVLVSLYQKIDTKKAASAIKKDTNLLKTKLTNLLTDLNVDFDPKVLKAVSEKNIGDALAGMSDFKIRYEFSRVVSYPDLTVLANSDDGLQSLRVLISKTQKDGQYFLKADKGLAKGEYALTSMDMLKDSGKGLTVLVGDFNDVVGRAIKSKSVDVAINIIEELKTIFDEVVVDVNSKMLRSETKMQKGESQYMGMLNQVVSMTGLSALATHHAAFALEDHYETHKNKASILLDYKIDNLMAKPNRYAGQFLLDSDQSLSIFAGNPGITANTGSFIDRSQIAPELHNPKLPDFPTPNGEDQTEYFISQTRKGFDKKVAIAFNKHCLEHNIGDQSREEEKVSFYKEYEERLAYEIKIIVDMGFPGYFLIKQDMINFCKENGIPVGAGRGSAAGSLVVFSLGITSIDPIEHGLIFERFLNPERVEMPDIDTDIPGDDREKVLRYAIEKYGQYGDGFSASAYIITKGTFSAKSTLKAVGKSKKMSVQWQNQLSDLIPKDPDITLEQALDEVDKLQARYETEAMTREVIDQALLLEKVKRQKSTGKHAGGIVVGNLVATSPIEYDRGIPVVQYDKNNIEAAGAVKFDLLGLGTLSIVDLAVHNVLREKGAEALAAFGISVDGNYIDFDELTYKDPKTYALLADANTSNVFQVESDGMKDLLLKIKPQNMEEIAALVALFRPGPLESGMVDQYINSKKDPLNIHYDAKVLEPILSPTYGAILYQEQVMRIANDMAGYSLGGADKLRKAMGKKKIEEMEKQRQTFMEGSIKNSHYEELATSTFDKMEKFAGYGFNKSHAVAYGDLTYKTALLKANFPVEFMAAVLTCVSQGNDTSAKINKAISSAKESEVTIVAPSVNDSRIEYIPSEKGVIYGLSGIKGASFDAIIEERDTNGDFKNIEDILLRVPSKGANKAALEALIGSGSLDKLPLSSKANLTGTEALSNNLIRRSAKRQMLMTEYHALKDLLSSVPKKKAYLADKKNGSLELDINYQESLNRVKKDTSAAVKDMLLHENDILSSYITGHPLDIGGIREKLTGKDVYPQMIPLSSIENIDNFKEDDQIRIAGVIKAGEFANVSAKGNKYARMTLDDGSSDHRIMLFESAIDAVNDELKSKLGRPLKDGDVISVLAEFKMRTNKQSGEEELNMNIDYIEMPEYDLNIQVNDYAKPYRKTNKSRYQYK